MTQVIHTLTFLCTFIFVFGNENQCFGGRERKREEKEEEKGGEEEDKLQHKKNVQVTGKCIHRRG